ncbi:MAG: pectate lyase [Pirellulales bacterium]
MNRTRPILFLLCVLLAPSAHAASFSLSKYANRPDAWFGSPEGAKVVENVLSHQSPHGSWPKNVDTAAARYAGKPEKLQGTFDNGATCGEIRFLARAYGVTSDARCQAAVAKAIDHILRAQYPSGGWPQYYPPSKRYHRHITFNDGTMVNLLVLLRDAARSGEFEFLDGPRRQRAGQAFDRGIACILKCQIVVDGQPTAWCAQHDEVTLQPRSGRTYEHPSISGAESAGIIRLLMSLDKPSPEVVRVVDAACRWYEKAKLTGIRQTRQNGDKVIVADPTAPPLWARFYEIGTNRPIFSGRDGVVKYNLAEIEPERRNGYAWYGDWGGVVAEWVKWKEKAAN